MPLQRAAGSELVKEFGHIFELLEIVSNVFIARERVPLRRKTGAIIGATLASGNVVTHAVADREGGCGLESQFEGGLAVSGSGFDGEPVIFQSGMQGLGFA
jgi:hypothetical protein